MPRKPSRSQWVHLVRRTVVQSSLAGLLLWTVSTAQVQTDIVSDDTMGTEVTPTGAVHDITGGMRPDNGQNLFHSFDRFSVGTGHTARFASDPGVNNIISRVTGGAESMIDGTLQAEVNLFLLNPQGIMFGPNATLNVNGSFHASTADALRFADGATFSARLSDKTTLTLAIPSAFGFLSENPAGIEVQGSELEVPEGETLSIIGGDITIVGDGDPSSGPPNLSAPRGRINLASVGSSGEVGFDPANQLPELDVGSFDQLGSVDIRQGALIDTSSSGGRGTVVIRSGRLLIDSSFLAADTLGDIDGAEVGIDIDIAEDVAITNGGHVRANTFGAGAAGHIEVKANNSVTISGQDRSGNQSALFANTFGSGNAGRVFVVTPTLDMTGGKVQAASSNSGSGNAGHITVEVERLMLTEGAQIDSSSFGTGHGGGMTITATESIVISGRGRSGLRSGLFSNAQGNIIVDSDENIDRLLYVSTPSLEVREGRIQALTRNARPAGNIELEVGQLSLMKGAQISSSTRGPGPGGSLTVIAHESIDILDESGGEFRSGLFSNSGEGEGGEPTGDAGNIVIKAPRLTMDGGRILSRTLGDGNAGNITIEVDRLELLGGGQIFNGIGNAQEDNSVLGNPDGEGHGGTLKITAREFIVISGRDSAGFYSGLFSSAQIGLGQAGDILVETPHLEMRNDGRISTASGSRSSGDAGELTVEVGTLVLRDGAQIASTTFGPGNGGTVTVPATDTITIAGQNSGIFANATGDGQGGDMTVHSSQLLLTDGATISAQSSGKGNAGTIQIAVIDLTLRDYSVVTTEATQAGGGNIEIEAQTVSLLDSDITATVGGGEGSGGDILIGGTINANSNIIEGLGRLTLERSRITANTDAGDGANIAIGARQVVLDSNSDVTANTKAGIGGNVIIAGTLAVDGQALTRAEAIVLRNSRITAKADAGKGGRIDIVAEAVLADPASDIDASSQAGIDGEVNIEAVKTNLSEIVTPLSPHFAQTAALLIAPCASRLQRGIVSSFVARGRASMPATPDGLLPSRLYIREIAPTEPESEGPREARALDPHVRLSRRRCP